METANQTPNHLITETSPYLQQHAYNPVDWYPWGEQALTLAKQQDKPILLSVGYSACHWCHVMAHESFEDPATARVMNELFINIKVDREERPDLDKIYQFAHQVLTQRGGGWPLTMMLMPDDQTPFFGGTYFPNEPRHGMPSFVDIMQRVAAFYREHPDDLQRQNQSLNDILLQVSQTTAVDAEALSATALDQSRHQLAQSYDGLYGGFGEAPKFPHPTHIERLLRHWHTTVQSGTADIRALDMVRTTLKSMALGGLFDQLGGGFYRYSVDQEWMIPHFEKMLYDNGPLLTLYAQAWQATGDKLFYRIAAETAEWVMREMQSTQGGYFSTLDADSEGEEGKFYAWDHESIKDLLSPEQYQIFARLYGFIKLDGSPGQANFEGRWHLHTMLDLNHIGKQLGLDQQTVQESLNEARQILFRAREMRIHPGRDEKILTSWNGLMIKGMAVAGRILDRPDFIESAERALDFIRDTLWQDGRLLVTYKDDKAHLMAYLDDYVFLIDAILELLQTRWRDGELDFAFALADVVLAQFEDTENGGFYFTADDHEKLIQRSKPFLDEAIPAGNGVAATVLQRLGHIKGESLYLNAAEGCLKAAWDSIQRTPHAHNALLSALEEYLYPPETIVLRGKPEPIQTWAKAVTADYVPSRMLLMLPENAVDASGVSTFYKVSGDICAYVCRNRQCSAPITTYDEFLQQCGKTM